MKKFIVALIAIFIATMFVSCGNSSTSNVEKARIEREQFIKDSIARVEFVKDSIATAQRNAEVIKRCANLFTIKKDEFSNNSWVKPKVAPKYRNRNGAYCYFCMNDGKPNTFRFVYQYYSDDWLFIRNMIFNIDGEKFTIIPKMETDCGGGKIWEWCDTYVSGGDSEYSVNENFISKLANSKSVKIKMNGSQYYDTRTLTAEQIKAIKDTYEYYLALGGKFS